jgi:membrane-bound lytic murein transglycosylase A
MKSVIYFLFPILLFFGCSNKPQVAQKEEIIMSQEIKQCVDENVTKSEDTSDEEAQNDDNSSQTNNQKVSCSSLPKTHLLKSDFKVLPHWEKEDYNSALITFIDSCRTKKTQKLYGDICEKAKNTQNAKEFLEKEFEPYEIKNENSKEEGLLTGYYEPHLNASLTKGGKYQYPIYNTPSDLIIVDLSSIYPALKDYRLRGRIKGNKLVPYYTRKETSSGHINAEVICYADSKLDIFFLEIQGSGRVTLDTGETMFIGFDNQNGHKYRAIGRYLVKIKALKLEEVSLQSIKKWLLENPSRVDEVLNYNESVVYFEQRDKAATGSLGIELTANRSIAVDQRYIPLGSMLYLNASKEKINKVVLAQDTGGAIKGAVRADLFLGHNDEAMNIAGALKAPLKLWILLPKNIKVSSL